MSCRRRGGRGRDPPLPRDGRRPRGPDRGGELPVGRSRSRRRARSQPWSPARALISSLRCAVLRRGTGCDGHGARRAARAPASRGREEDRLGRRRRPCDVHRELEGGLVDVVEVETPAVLTIQTGINEPRYATLRAIKQAEQQEIDVVEPDGLGSRPRAIRRMFVPPKGEGAEMLGDDPAEVAGKIKQIVEERMR